MQRTGLILGLTVASLASLFVWRETENGVAMLIAVALLAFVLAQFYWAGFASTGGSMSRYGLGLLALCGVAAYILLGIVDGALKPPTALFSRGDRSMARTTEWLAELILPVLPVLPLLLSGLRNAGTGRPPLWPIIAGLAGGGALWLVVAFTWVSLAEPALTRPSEINQTALFAILVLAEAGLVGGLGGTIWLKALDLRRPSRFEGNHIFAGTVIVTVLLLGVGMILALWGTIRLAGSAENLGRNGEAWCGVLLVLLAIAWIWALLRVRDVEPARSVATVLIVAALFILFALSFTFPASLLGAREWTPLVLLLVAPVTILGAALIAAFGPRLIRAAAYR